MPDSDVRTPAGRAWLPGVTGVALLLIAAAIQKVWSIDFWWQLRNGEWIVEHLAVPRQEMYSWTNAGAPLREMRWIYCAVIYLLYSRVGEWAPSVLQALAVTGVWIVVAWPYRRNLRHPLAVLLLALGIAAGLGRWVMRPELATYLEFALFLMLLTELRTAATLPARRRWLIVGGLAGLQVLWTNLHTLFLFGPVLAWCFVCGDALQRFIDRRRALNDRPLVNLSLVAAAVGVSAACWVNPYFHDGAMYALQMYRETRGEHATSQFIGEMRSPLRIPIGDWTWDLTAAAALGLLSVAIAAAHRRQFDVVRAGILLLGLILFAQLQRNAPLLAICTVWASLGNLAAPRTTVSDVLSPAHPWAKAGHVGVLVACGLAAWFVVTDRIGPRLNQPREFGLGVVKTTLPSGAAEFLKEHKPTGNLFNTIRDGAYLIWSVRDQPVYIDGRTDAYGPRLLNEASTLTGSQWEEWSREHRIGAAVFPTQGYDDLIAAASASTQWALVFVDHRDVVFLRRNAENSGIIGQCEIRADADWSPQPTAAGPEGEPSWKHAIGGVNRAWQSEGLGHAWLVLGQPERARPYLRRGLEIEPGNPRIAMDYAPLLFADGNAAEASRVLANLSEARRLATLKDAASSLMKTGEIQLAEAPLKNANVIAPDDREVLVALADVRFQTGRLELAAADYERAQRLSATVNEWNKLGTIYGQLNDVARAERALRESLRLDAQQPAVWNMLGGMLGRQGKLDEAEACFRRALELRPDFKSAQENLDRVRAAKGTPPR